MSRYFIINETIIEIFLEDENECFYKTNGICFNNKCKWLGKKCHQKCSLFKKEILKKDED